jgi:hypothetical protein
LVLISVGTSEGMRFMGFRPVFPGGVGMVGASNTHLWRYRTVMVRYRNETRRIASVTPESFKLASARKDDPKRFETDSNPCVTGVAFSCQTVV